MSGKNSTSRFAAVVKQARSMLGLSSEDMAGLLRVTARTVNGWESGSSEPQRAHRIVLAALVGAKQVEGLAGDFKAVIDSLNDDDSPAPSTDLTFLTNQPGSDSSRPLPHPPEKGHTFLRLPGWLLLFDRLQFTPSLAGECSEDTDPSWAQTDRTIYDAIGQAGEQRDFEFSHAEVKEQIPEVILAECERAPDTPGTEAGVRAFVEWIRSGKLEIRAYPTGNIHAKVYIMTFGEGDRDVGRVITGSSNLSQAGLQEQLEFNVELKNRADYEYSLQKFNELWADGVDVSKEFVQTIDTKSPYAHFTPFELYLKFLYEYFKTEVNRPDRLDDSYLPPDLPPIAVSGRSSALRKAGARGVRRRLLSRRGRPREDVHVRASCA